MAGIKSKAPAPRALAITRLALIDLDLKDPTYIGENPVDLVSEHAVIADFVRLRSQCREGQEPTLGVKPTTWNLHTGQWRSVTWFDEANDVCWLVGSNRAHDYAIFVDRSRRRALIPTRADLADLKLRESAADDFVDIALAQAENLLREVNANPDVEHSQILGDEIEMSLYLELLGGGRKRLWVLFKVPPRGRKDLPGELVEILSGLFFSDDLNVNWYSNSHPARPAGLDHDERAMSWTY